MNLDTQDLAATEEAAIAAAVSQTSPRSDRKGGRGNSLLVPSTQFLSAER